MQQTKRLKKKPARETFIAYKQRQQINQAMQSICIVICIVECLSLIIVNTTAKFIGIFRLCLINVNVKVSNESKYNSIEYIFNT